MKKSPFGTWGVVIGVIAFGVALTHFWFGPFQPDSRTVEEVVADQAVAIKQALVAKLKGEELPQKAMKSSIDIDEIVTNATIVAAFVTLVLAIISFLRKENVRFTGTAAVLGGASLAFQFLLVAIGTIIILTIILAVLGHIDF